MSFKITLDGDRSLFILPVDDNNTHNCMNFSVTEDWDVFNISGIWHIGAGDSCSPPIHYCPYCGKKLD